MFTEFKQVRQIPGEPRRRWFASDRLQLIVWHDRGEAIIGFQLLYEIERESKSISWDVSRGFLHGMVDDGDVRYGKHKQTPILMPNGSFEKTDVLAFFLKENAALPDEIAVFVKNKLEEYESE